MRARIAGGIAALWLAGCATDTVPPVAAPVTAPAFDAVLTTAEPKPMPHQCWHRTVRPALFETVTEQVLVAPEQRDAAGTVLQPAVFRSEVRQSQIRPRQTVWFRIPCRAEIASEEAFVASLQRALKARGLFGGEVTGTMDDATEAAVLRYQSANGLENSVLSLAAAQALGLVAVTK